MFFNHGSLTVENLEAARKGLLAICSNTGDYFNLGEVEVTERYADCTMFKCPACHKTHDDRRSFFGRDSRSRSGYTLVDFNKF